MDGHFLPGHPVSENEISARLGVSRTPVREALIVLEEEGLIVVYPQYGSFVAPIRIADLYDSQFVREALECAALEQAIMHLDAAGEQQMQALLQTQKRHLSGDAAPFSAADEALHATIMRIAGHARAWRMVKAAKAQHDRVCRLADRDPLRRRTILAEHTEIVARAIARQTPEAVAAMRRHLRCVFNAVEVAMRRHPELFAAFDPPSRPAKVRIGASDAARTGAREPAGAA